MVLFLFNVRFDILFSSLWSVYFRMLRAITVETTRISNYLDIDWFSYFDLVCCVISSPLDLSLLRNVLKAHRRTRKNKTFYSILNHLLSKNTRKRFICYVNNNLWSHWISISSQNIYVLSSDDVLPNEAIILQRSIASVRYIVNFFPVFRRVRWLRSSRVNKALHQ